MRAIRGEPTSGTTIRSYLNTIKINPNYGFTRHATYHGDGFDVRYLGGWAHHNLQIFSNAAGDNRRSPRSASRWPRTPNPALFGFGSLCATGQPGLRHALRGPLTTVGLAADTYTENKSWTSHEVDFLSTTTSAFQWIGGLYYYHEQYNQSIDITLPNQPQLSNTLVFGTGPAAPFAGSSATTPVLAAPNPTRLIYDSGQNMAGNSYAGFGEVDWKFTPAWKLTLGLRYSYDDKKGNEFLRLVTFGAAFATPEQLGTLTPAWDETSFLVQGAEPGASAVTIGADGFGRRIAGRPLVRVHRHGGPGVGSELGPARLPEVQPRLQGGRLQRRRHASRRPRSGPGDARRLRGRHQEDLRPAPHRRPGRLLLQLRQHADRAGRTGRGGHHQLFPAGPAAGAQLGHRTGVDLAGHRRPAVHPQLRLPQHQHRQVGLLRGPDRQRAEHARRIPVAA